MLELRIELVVQDTPFDLIIEAPFQELTDFIPHEVQFFAWVSHHIGLQRP